MNTFNERLFVPALTGSLRPVGRHFLVLALALVAAVPAGVASGGKAFATPEAAVSALAAAAGAVDSNALRVVFGPAAAELENPDRVQATNEIEAFAAALNQVHRIIRESDSKCVLEVGEENWPFPVPIVKRDGQWSFDTEAAKEELLTRRIGRNELAALQVVRGYVEAQREYASRDRDGDRVLEYAQKIASSPNQRDGLYWTPDLDGEISPLGPFAARAQAMGYGGKFKDEQAESEPFNGYFFKVLTRQAKSAPGGKYNYIINQNMIGGFALVAWPAEYGDSGIMTFIVNQEGVVYQKDLGVKTVRNAGRIEDYNPDGTWTISPE